VGFVYWETKTDAFVQMANGGLGRRREPFDRRARYGRTADPRALFGPIAQTQVDGFVLQSLASGPLTCPVMDAMH
jgi:hypothetical protein